MGFFDFINRILKRDQKRLPEAKYKTENRVKSGLPKSYDDARKFNNSVKVDYIPKPDTLEFAIEQYLASLSYQTQNGEFYSPYNALVALCSIDNSVAGNNARNETELLKRIEKDKKSFVFSQSNLNGDVFYRHISHGSHKSKDEYRLYINCKRENIAALARKFIDELGDSEYYFKFCADEHANKKRRSEQFVFYLGSDEIEMNNILQAIERTRQKNPKLFEASRNVNPFMRKLTDYIGYAPEVEGKFVNLHGQTIPISESYNTLLSEALDDAFYHSVKEVVARDLELSKKVKGECFKTSKEYVQKILPEILGNRPDSLKKLVTSMKTDLVTLSRLNPELQIKGVTLEKKKDRSHNVEEKI